MNIVTLRTISCETCTTEIRIGGAKGKHLRTRFCSRRCSALRGRRGAQSPETPVATVSPTPLDLAWAAGIYEGEGHARRTSVKSCAASVVQKDRWLLHRFVALFGGRIVGPHGKSGCYQWITYGARSRGFLMTVYKFLSPRRREQARRAIGAIA